MSPWDLPADDLASSVDTSRGDLEVLRGSRVLVTGGTGFLGSWLVGTLLWANASMKLGLQILLITRNPSAVPFDSTDAVRIVGSDVRTLRLGDEFDVIVHGAASSSARFGEGDGTPSAMAKTIVEGTEAVLEVARATSARLLFLSSGAVYGPQLAPVGEDSLSGPDPMDFRSAYGQAKRLAETLCASATQAGDADAVVARLFAFVGPRLPRDAHYAAGNFLADAVGGRPIQISGDGRPFRSYLYAGDLPEWCWALIARGASGRAYNVGGDESISIADLARRVAALTPTPSQIEIRGTPKPGDPACYVPVLDRAATELGLFPRTNLDTALNKTFNWFATHP